MAFLRIGWTLDNLDRRKKEGFGRDRFQVEQGALGHRAGSRVDFDVLANLGRGSHKVGEVAIGKKDQAAGGLLPNRIGDQTPERVFPLGWEAVSPGEGVLLQDDFLLIGKGHFAPSPASLVIRMRQVGKLENVLACKALQHQRTGDETEGAFR